MNVRCNGVIILALFLFVFRMWTFVKLSHLSLLLLSLFSKVTSSVNDNEIPTCNLPQNLITEISSYESTVNKIIHETTTGTSKGFTYTELDNFIDQFGDRIAGSENLENAIDYMLNASNVHNLENVHGEKVEVPHWVRLVVSQILECIIGILSEVKSLL